MESPSRVVFAVSLASLFLSACGAGRSQLKASGPQAVPVPVQAAASAPAPAESVPALPGLPVPVEAPPADAAALLDLLGGGPPLPGGVLQPVPVEILPSGEKVLKVWIWQESSDCLWNMAKEHYGNPFLWTRIYEANRETIEDPGKIYPKQRIVIPPLESGGS